MAKLAARWWVLAGLLLLGLYGYGYGRMFFHQDDLDWLILASGSWTQLLSAPIGDHVNYLWRVLLKTEWELFGLNFPWYLAVSVLLHGVNVYWLYLNVRELSGQVWMARVAALIFTINTNWSETVLWMSGQTILITACMVLWSTWAVMKQRGEAITLLLASWTSALALGWIGAVGLVKGVDGSKRKISRLGWVVGGIGLVTASAYLWQGGDGTRVIVSWAWMGKVVVVAGLGVINTVLGRLVIPFERWEMLRIGLTSAIVAGSMYGLRKWWGEWWRDQWTRLLLVQLLGYYLIVAVGRAQYGVGIMRADRYGYLGLAIILMWLARVGRKLEWRWWGGAVVAGIMLLQVAGLYIRAQEYIVRPQQMRVLFEQIQNGGIDENNREQFLPHFVLNDERLRYRDIEVLFNKH